MKYLVIPHRTALEKLSQSNADRVTQHDLEPLIMDGGLIRLHQLRCFFRSRADFQYFANHLTIPQEDWLVALRECRGSTARRIVQQYLTIRRSPPRRSPSLRRRRRSPSPRRKRSKKFPHSVCQGIRRVCNKRRRYSPDGSGSEEYEVGYIKK